MARLTITANDSEPTKYASTAASTGAKTFNATSLPASSEHKLKRALFCQCAVHRPGIQELHAHLRIHLQQVTTPPAVDGDARQIQNARLDKHRHGPAGGKGRGAAHQVTAVPVGHLGLARLHAFGADFAGQIFGGYRE